MPVVVLVDHRLVYRASWGGGASLKPAVLCPLYRVFSRSSIIRNDGPFLPTGGALMNCPVIIQQLGNDTTWLPLRKESVNKSIRILVTMATATSLESKITKKIVSFNLANGGYLEHLENGYQFQPENLSLGILGNRRESEGWYIVSLEENVQVQQFCIQLKLYGKNGSFHTLHRRAQKTLGLSQKQSVWNWKQLERSGPMSV